MALAFYNFPLYPSLPIRDGGGVTAPTVTAPTRYAPTPAQIIASMGPQPVAAPAPTTLAPLSPGPAIVAPRSATGDSLAVPVDKTVAPPPAVGMKLGACATCGGHMETPAGTADTTAGGAPSLSKQTVALPASGTNVS